MFCSVHRCTSMYNNRNLSLTYFVSALKCPLKLKYPSICRCPGICFFFISKTTHKDENKLNFESALLSALLPPTGVSFYVNLVKFCVVKLNEVSKLEPIQKHYFWWPEAPRTFPDWSWTHLGKFFFFHNFCEISGVIFFMIWGAQVRLNISKCMEQLRITP